MNILAIETVTSACSVALCYQNEVSQKRVMDPTGHSKHVLNMVRSLCADFAIRLGDLDVIAVDVGPGSFTGVRIGIGVAQGLAYGADVPAVGIESLEALAVTVDKALVVPALDARMNQIYFACYETDVYSAVPKVASSVGYPNEIDLDPQDRTVIGLGSGWDRYEDQMRACFPDGQVKYRPSRYPEARFVAGIAEKRGPEHYLCATQLAACYVRNKVAHPGAVTANDRSP